MSTKDQTQIKFRINLIGDSSVGKTCFFQRFFHEIYLTSHIATVGLEKDQKIITLENGTSVLIELWDTAGQERFRSITKSYFKAANGFIVMYDITNQNSFDNLEKWLTCLEEMNSDKTLIYIFGNKCDKVDQRIVQTEDGRAFAEKNKCGFYETSALEIININNSIEEMIEILYKDLIKKQVDKVDKKDNQVCKLNYKKDIKSSKKKSCCEKS